MERVSLSAFGIDPSEGASEHEFKLNGLRVPGGHVLDNSRRGLFPEAPREKRQAEFELVESFSQIDS